MREREPRPEKKITALYAFWRQSRENESLHQYDNMTKTHRNKKQRVILVCLLAIHERKSKRWGKDGSMYAKCC